MPADVSRRRIGSGLLLASVLVFWWGAPVPAQTATGRDLILIVDLSGTMVGRSGGVDIFAQVKATAKDIISELELGDTVTLVTFDRAAHEHVTVVLLSETERQRVFRQIDDLQATGKWTYTADALRIGLDEAARLEQSALGHQKVVLILTDGRNNPPPGLADTLRLPEVTKPFAGRPWYVYQVQLGPAVDTELSEALQVFPNSQTIHDPRGVNLPKLAQRLTAPPPPPTIAVSPSPLHVRLETPGEPATATAEVRITGGSAAATPNASIEPGRLPDFLHAEVSVAQKDQRTVLTVVVSPAGRVTRGTYPATVIVSDGSTTSTNVDLDVEVAFESPPRWPYYAGGAVLLLLLAATGIWLRLRGRRLSGSLEWWPTATPGAVRREDDLGRLGRRAMLGSDALPLAGVTAPLATLTMEKAEDDYLVCVTPAEGQALRHAGVSVPTLRLYDSDTFQIGELTFRYRGDVGRRPRGAGQGVGV